MYLNQKALKMSTNSFTIVEYLSINFHFVSDNIKKHAEF